MLTSFLACLVIGSTVVSNQPQSAPAPGNVVGASVSKGGSPKGAIDLAALEKVIVELVNIQRRGQGLPPLSVDPSLSRLARDYSRDMVERKYFAHVDPEGRRVGVRVEQTAGIVWTNVGENIARNKGYNDPATTAVRGWMDSQGHRENILNGKFRETGIGAWIAPDNTVYFTQIFLSRKP